MDFYYPNNQLSGEQTYSSTNSYSYNISYPTSNTLTQTTEYTRTNFGGNSQESYQYDISNAEASNEKYTTTNADYNISYDYNNIDLNTATNYDNYFQNENYQSNIYTSEGKNYDLSNIKDIKVLPTKYLPTKIIGEGETLNLANEFATVIPLKQGYPSGKFNFSSTETATDINDYYNSVVSNTTYSNQQYEQVNNYETQIEPQTITNYELNNEASINATNTFNTFNITDTTGVDTNMYTENNVIANEPINLPQENYENIIAEEIYQNKVETNNNYQINSPEIYQKVVEKEVGIPFIHKSPEINYKLNAILSPLHSPLAKYETQSYNAEDNFDIKEMLRLKEENEFYKEQLKDLNRYKAEAAQVKELKEQVEQLSPLKEKVAEMDLLKAQLQELNTLRAKVNQLEKLKLQIEKMDYNGQKGNIQSMEQYQKNSPKKEIKVKVEKLAVKKENNENIETMKEEQELDNRDSNIEHEHEIHESNILDTNMEGVKDADELDKRDSNDEEVRDTNEIENRDSNIEQEQEHEPEPEPEQEVHELDNRDENVEQEPEQEQEHEEQEIDNRESNIEQNQETNEIENRDSNIEIKQDTNEVENRETNIEQKPEIKEIEARDFNTQIKKESKKIDNRDSNLESEERSSQAFVKGDIIHDLEELEMIIRKINKESSKITLNLLYKATADSDRAKVFHKKCDKAKCTLVLVETDKGRRFGGYTSVDWSGKCIEKNDEEAFVFSLDKMKIYEVIPDEKAIGCYPKFGPVFLGCQIRIYDHAFKNGGTTFEKELNFNTDEDYVLNGGERTFNVKEIEVYEVIAQ